MSESVEDSPGRPDLNYKPSPDPNTQEELPAADHAMVPEDMKASPAEPPTEPPAGPPVPRSPRPISLQSLEEKFRLLGEFNISPLSLKKCACKPSQRVLRRLTGLRPRTNSSGHRIYKISADINVLGFISLAGLKGWVAVNSEDIVVDSRVQFSAPFVVRYVGGFIGLIAGFSIPRMTGHLSGLDTGDHLLFTGRAKGFHYLPYKPIDRVMYNAGYVRSADGEGSEHFVQFVREKRGYKQMLRYNGPFGIYNVKGKLDTSFYCSQGPVDFENLPLRLGARLGLGLNLPI